MTDKNRVSRKELLNEPDEFITLSAKAIMWAREHETQLYTAMVIGSMIILILSGWSFFKTRSEQKASTMLAEAQSMYSTQMARTDSEEAAMAAGKKFQSIAEEYSGTKAGKVATAMTAQTYYDSGDYDTAIQWWETALKGLDSDPIEESQILLGIAYAYEQKADYAKASEYFKKVLDIQGGVGAEDATLAMARVYEAMGDTEKSLQTYQQFADDYPDSAYHQMAKEKLASSSAG